MVRSSVFHLEWSWLVLGSLLSQEIWSRRD
jgi:hypothetical protein